MRDFSKASGILEKFIKAGVLNVPSPFDTFCVDGHGSFLPSQKELMRSHLHQLCAPSVPSTFVICGHPDLQHIFPVSALLHQQLAAIRLLTDEISWPNMAAA
jgi:hypothetical protein